MDWDLPPTSEYTENGYLIVSNDGVAAAMTPWMLKDETLEISFVEIFLDRDLYSL